MIVRNKIILILGRPGEWKTYLASFIASNYRRIYSNVNILDREWKPITNFIENIEDLKKISFDPEKWVALLDEWWININARASWSKENRTYWELGMLGRKLNVDFIICAQLWRMIDVYFRELANYIFEMHAWFDRKDYLLFEARIFWSGGEHIVKVARFDLFEWTRLTWFSYNTLDTSRISKKIEKKSSGIIYSSGSDIKTNKKNEFEKKWFNTDFLATEPIWTTEADTMFWRDAIIL